MKQHLSKKILVILFIIITGCSKSWAQTISGVPGPFTCVFEGNSCTYMISDFSTGSTDKWCVIGGTLNGTTDSCISNTGSPVINVTWKPGVTNGKILYYKPANAATPTAVFNITVLKPGSIVTSNSSYSLPYIPQAVPLNLTLTTSETISCSEVMTYQWQKSSDGKNYTDIPGATAKDYLVTESFTQNVYYRRNVFPAQNANGIIGVSTIMLIVKP